MKILAVTHGEMIQVMLTMSEVLEKKVPHDLSLVVSDSGAYFGLSGRSGVGRKLAECSVLREWELADKARDVGFRSDTLLALEEELGEPLMRTAQADRRLLNGRRCMNIQDYGAVLSGDQLNQLIAYAYGEIDKFLEEEAPDVVLSFGSDTYCDYVVYRLCEKRGIRFLVLNSCQELGNVLVQQEFSVWPQAIWDAFKATNHLLEAGDMKLECIEAAHRYVEKVEQGVQLERRQIVSGGMFRNIGRLLKAVFLNMWRELNPALETDLHRDSSFTNIYYEQFVRSRRHARQTQFLEPFFTDLEELKGGKRRIYFPLQYEPTADLQGARGVISNQIEIVRTLALSAPADVEILVKDHPKSRGRRSNAYYRKLLEIPRVRLLRPDENPSEAMRFCHACVVVTGVTALEAAIVGKPVLVLGETPYEAVGEPHFFKVSGLQELEQVLREILEPEIADAIRKEGEEKFTRLLSIVYVNSCRIDLKEAFLGRSCPETANRFSEHIQRSKQIDAFVDYMAERLSADSGNAKTSEQAA